MHVYDMPKMIQPRVGVGECLDQRRVEPDVARLAGAPPVEVVAGHGVAVAVERRAPA